MSNDGCGAPEGGVRLEDAPDLGSQAVVAGTVTSSGAPVHPAYVRLLNEDGDFVAEVPTDTGGEFRFYAAPGDWTVRMLAPGKDGVEQVVTTDKGKIARVELQV